MSPKADAYLQAALELVGALLIAFILYYAHDESPTLREFFLISGPGITVAIRAFLKRSPRDVWDEKNDRRANRRFYKSNTGTGGYE